MKNVKLVTKYDFKTVKYCNWYMMKYKRKIYVVYGVLIAMCIVAAATIPFVSKTGNPFVWTGVFGLMALYSIYQALTIEKKLDKQLIAHFDHKPAASQLFEVTDEKITVLPMKDGEQALDYDWAYITEIHAIPQYYILVMGKMQQIILDRSAEAIVEGTQSDLDEIIKEKTGTRPYKSLDIEILSKPITYVAPVFTPDDAVEVENQNNDDQYQISEEQVEEATLEEDKQSEDKN